MKTNVKIIFHVDMNAFFASVEEINSPFLKGKPFIVSNRVSDKGIVSTASYEARKFGIHSAMPKIEALRRCKDLIVVDTHYQNYLQYSKKFMRILNEYSDTILQASIDEAYLDMTKLSEKRHPLEIAEEIQKRLLEELQLPCSIGIGPTLFLAKMGSDYKKPLGITVIRKRDVKKMLYSLKIGSFYGIGKKSVKIYNDLGIYTIGDLANYDEEKLRNKIGENAYSYIKSCLNGTSNDIVDPNKYQTPMSIGNSYTMLHETNNEDELKKLLYSLSEMVSKRLNKENQIGKTVSIQIKYANFLNITRNKTINNYIENTAEIYNIAEELFDKNIDFTQNVRLLGVTVSNLKERNIEEINLFNMQKLEKEQEIINTLKKLKEKYGDEKIKKGISKWQ